MINSFRKAIYLIITIIALTTYNTAVAQSTRIRGRITDATTGEPVPLASITFAGTTIGTSSDFEGNYFIETRSEITDPTLTIFLIGYKTQNVPITKNSFNTIDIKLEQTSFDVEKVTIEPDDSYVRSIMRKVNENKFRNDPTQLDQYDCSIYTKMELDLQNIKPDNIKNKKLKKNFGFVFEYMDTSVVTGKSFLPIMISESNSDFYYRKNPSFSREIIKASRISGIEQDYSLAQFTGHLHVDVNYYDNYITIFNIKFASPLSEHSNLFYKYYLIDSIQMDGRKTYEIRFHPRNVSTPVLDGEIFVDAETYALVSAKSRMVKNINVNWIRDLVIEASNQFTADSIWFKKQDRLFADFSVVMNDSSKLISFLGNRQIDYSNIHFNREIPKDILRLDNNIIINDNVLNNDEQYWQSVRPHALSQKEQNIYKMVDSIKNVPLYQNIYTVVSTIIGGYYDAGKFEYGPYYKLVSFNDIEGVRMQFGMRTTAEFSKKFRLSGYGAYGTKDRALKGGGSIEWMFNRQPTRKLSLAVKHDMVQLGASEDAFTESNILSSLLSRNNERLSLINQANLTYNHEWRHGINSTYDAQVQKIFGSEYIPMIRPDGTHIQSVSSASMSIGTRFSWNETVNRTHFDKQYIYTKAPVITIKLTGGVGDVKDESYDFAKVEGSIQYFMSVPPLGTSEFIISGGKIFGEVPYTMLKLHEGNGTYFYNPSSFSCMNYYEFASDEWIQFMFEHDFKGFFLGKIPLMKRLKWREVITFKGVYGTLSDRNNGSLPNSTAVLLFPEGMADVHKPYMEAGVGIKNIFRLFRIDAVWRLSHRQKSLGHDETDNFAVNFGVGLTF